MPFWLEIGFRLLLASILGGLIGWDREVQRKPAGLRTVTLVSLSAAMFVIAAHEVARQYGEPVDAVRAMAGIAQGIGFLGAGAIVQSRRRVFWLTTAAALWAAAAIGFAVGSGVYSVAIIGSIIVFIVLRWLAMVEERWFSHAQQEDEQEKRVERDDRTDQSHV